MTIVTSKMSKDRGLLALVLALLIVIPNTLGVSKGQLRFGFYAKTCPNAGPIIHQVVQEAVANDPRNAAVLLRLHFHDCFVEGCDGSILLKNDADGEQLAQGNLGVRGFDIIDSAKKQLENACPGVVSCADIVALAARDAVSLVKGPFYDVPTGRRDGRVSKMSLAQNLPDVDDSINVLKSKFRAKGLSDKDLVLLSGGAHTIGKTACFFMQKRLYGFTPRGGSDPAVNPGLLPQLKAMCPFNGDVNVPIPLDVSTENVFDVQILRNIRDGNAVIASDARLLDDINTRQILESYISSDGSTTRPSFDADFAAAMVRMGSIGVKTGAQGEIRRVCSAVN